MNKIWLIVEREYLSRVKKKSFLILTLVGPLLFGAITILPVWMAMREKSTTHVAVLDRSGLFGNKLKSNSETKFEKVEDSESRQKDILRESDDHHLLLVIGETDGVKVPEVRIFGQSNPSLDLISSLESQIKEELKNLQLKKSGIDPVLVEKIKPDVKIRTTVLQEEGEKEGSAAAATIVGFAAGFLIYLFIFLYGSQVMMGVMEEKTNRVVEILISSVRPFELMLGKILGIALVGLTQFLLWLVLSYGVTTAASGFLSRHNNTAVKAEIQQTTFSEVRVQKKVEKLGVLEELKNVNVIAIVSYFIFYFLGGYLLYSALFAAVGAAVENQQDAQQFMFPITIPIIGAIVMAQFIIKDPNSPMAFWLSVFPLTSPIIMMIRVPFEPPVWQILVSMVCLALGFLGTTWLAGKIYRVGILMFGKKVTYHELWKWMRY